eukprot:COSAG01_NODE_17325_length_1159_cov_19.770755_2_plen_114_part_00
MRNIAAPALLRRNSSFTISTHGCLHRHRSYGFHCGHKRSTTDSCTLHRAPPRNRIGNHVQLMFVPKLWQSAGRMHATTKHSFILSPRSIRLLKRSELLRGELRHVPESELKSS